MADETGAADVREGDAADKGTGKDGERVLGTSEERKVAAAAVQTKGDRGEEDLAANCGPGLRFRYFLRNNSNILSVH